jgi:type I restriction enzyme S subunit
MLSDKILRFRLAVLPERWLLLTLRSQEGRNEIERLATGNQDSMRNIGQDRIKQIRIPLPDESEMERIIEEYERLLSISEAMEHTVEQSLKQAERMRQSILKRAFEGKLVPQDPNDEPAELLLERIKHTRAKREAEKSAASKPNRGRSRKKQNKRIQGAAA